MGVFVIFIHILTEALHWTFHYINDCHLTFIVDFIFNNLLQL